tara:strand:+ start:377 stop:487 length:111 start_codon:yes stop_codon:yes gene_type:complete
MGEFYAYHRFDIAFDGFWLFSANQVWAYTAWAFASN